MRWRRDDGRVLVVMSGLPGTGKSAIADALGHELGAPVFSVDEHLGDADLVAITHGTVMAAWLAAAGVVADSPSFWPQLRLPDGWEIDLAEQQAWRVA